MSNTARTIEYLDEAFKAAFRCEAAVSLAKDHTDIELPELNGMAEELHSIGILLAALRDELYEL